MKLTTTLHGSFQASHEYAGCKGGHEYSVDVTIGGTNLADIAHDNAVKAAEKIEDICDELNRRKLNDMIGAGTPSVWGLALYLWERFVMVVDGLEEVSVHESDGPTAKLSRT